VTVKYAKPFRLIKRRTKGGGAVWYYLLRGEHTKHTTGERRKDRAAEYVGRLLGAPSGARLTLEEYSRGFFLPGADFILRQRGKDRRFGDAHARKRQGHLTKWIIPALGKHQLAEITPVLIERWISGVPRSAQTKTHLLSALRIILRDAKRAGLVEHNAADDVEPPGKVYRHRDALTLDELRLLFPAARDELVKVWGAPQWGVAFLLMATTGMRVGEVCALLWQHVRWEIPAVIIIQSVKTGGEIGPPKSGRPRAALLPARAVDALTWWRAETPWPDGYVVPNPHGSHASTRRAQELWHPAALRAGIRTEGRYLGAHALRHTWETRMRGLLPEEAMRYMLGHGSAAMSERYDQATPEERVLRIVGQRGAIDRLWQ
jgi:integrase